MVGTFIVYDLMSRKTKLANSILTIEERTISYEFKSGNKSYNEELEYNIKNVYCYNKKYHSSIISIFLDLFIF